MCVTRLLGLHRRIKAPRSADASVAAPPPIPSCFHHSGLLSFFVRRRASSSFPSPRSPSASSLQYQAPLLPKCQRKWIGNVGNELVRAYAFRFNGRGVIKEIASSPKSSHQSRLYAVNALNWRAPFVQVLRWPFRRLKHQASASSGMIVRSSFRSINNPFKFYFQKLSEVGCKTSHIKYYPREPRALRSQTVIKRYAKRLAFWRCAWEKLKVRILSNTSRGLVIKAVSLAFARSHLPLGLVTLFLGNMNRNIAEAQSYSWNTPSSSLFSGFFTMVEFVKLIARSIFLFFLFMPVVVSAPFADLFGGRFRQTWLRLVCSTLEFAGAAFIKWGQWAATRPDLFPRDLCLELTKLHSNAPAHKFSHSIKTVEQAFGRKLNEIFEDFEVKPVASGSIAQVHKATLRYSGNSHKKSKPMVVAVKVRHPGVTEIIRRDFIIINWIANLSTMVPGLSWLRLDESVRQFAVFMLTQVDLAREAAHLSRFLYNFRNWRDVSFPRPLYPLVHPAVLVETYEHGESVSHFIELSEEKGQSSRTLAHIGTHTFLKMLIVDNFIHADMHPGNILVRVKKKSAPGKGRSRPHLVFLDVGLTAELSQKDRQNLLEFFKAVALRDGRTAAQCALSFSRNQSCPNPSAFINELETSFTFWGSREADVIHPGECMQDLLEQVRKHRVNIDGDVCTVIVTIMVLEGWQRRLDPDYNIMDTLQKLLFKKDWVESLSYTINGIMAP